ncbi:uncharacterized protein LOC131231678 [Magnolia sinica]|uniref:uncharacterized protein LOC131231678 n=1 Tax=Magnolia sinica TaxID=86752 RepID=UPI002659DD56|nr:uncharacterized protein LOC131231678 [Magnolia sinica]
MAEKTVQYSVIDAFTQSPFKGNPAAVCLLEEERDDAWMRSVALEFNIALTAFLTRITPSVDSENHDRNQRFGLRWFTRGTEVKICGHATLAAAHFLFTSGLATTNTIEFLTKSGLLTARRVDGFKQPGTLASLNENAEELFSIELDFPTIPLIECNPEEHPSIPRTLNGVPMINIKKAAILDDLVVELSSGNAVAELQPQFDELQECAGRGVIITGLAPPGSGFDFCTRFFCPKLGVNEDAVCGSAHCALAPYWSKKLGKHDLIAYMASPRGGRLDLHLEETTQRVLIRGEAVTIMSGLILV